MPCSNPEYTGSRNDSRPWENFVRTINYNVPSYFEPDTLENLVWILEKAEEDGKAVKAVGSGWSIEDIAVSQEWVVDINQLSNRITTLIDGNTISNAVTSANRTLHLDSTADSFVHVEAGIKIIDLNRMLQGLGLSMITLGGAQGQTIAGAIATSTHGSDIEHPPIPDLVEAIHLVTNGGREYWIEASSTPFTDNNDQLLDTLSCSEITIIRDDKLFNSVKVSVGRFGVIYSYVFRVTNTFRTTEWANKMSWSSVSEKLVEGIDSGNLFETIVDILPDPPSTLNISTPASGFRYFDLAFNPRNKQECWVRRRWLTNDPGDMNLGDSGNFLCHHGVGNAILASVSAILSIYSGVVALIPFYGWVKSIEIAAEATRLATLSLDPHMTGGKALAEATNSILSSQIGSELEHHINEINQMAIDQSAGSTNGSPKRGVYWQVNSGTTESAFDRDCFNGSSIEVIFDTSNRTFIDFINEILNNGTRFTQIGYISVRFSRSSNALLSMHNVESHIAVSIEVTSLDGLDHSSRWLDFVEQVALANGGRLHWGQRNHLTSMDIALHYGGKIGVWRDQLDRIVRGSPMFSNNYTRRRGLEPIHVRRLVTAVRREGGTITHLCNEDEYWSPITVESAMAEITTGRVNYMVSSPDGGEQFIIVREYLMTDADSITTNNLRSLPDAFLRLLPRPATDLIERRVTHIQVRTSGPNPWKSWVSFLGNLNEGWAVSISEAQLHVQNDTFIYYILNDDGTKNILKYRKYLLSDPNEFLEDNLDQLPNC